jgi:two-component system chemotaxis sensor kinase CheA
MDDLLREFLTETNEGLATLDTQLVQLEQNPNDPQLISSIFRIMHTIKGTCGFIGLPRLESVAHAGENVLGKLRDKVFPVTPEAVTIILEALDAVKHLVTALEETGKEPEGADTALIARLNAFADGQGIGAGAGGEAPPAAPLDPLEEAFKNAPGPEDMAAAMAAEPEPVVAPPSPPAAAASEPAAAKAEAKPAGGGGGGAESAIANQSIRVNVDLLENLMTTISELVLTRNQLLQILRGQGESTFTVPLQRLNQITSELQDGVMKTRMQPIGNAWSKLPRIVRDLSVELGKKMDLVMLGAETELDRQVLELIKDPLTHMVRNSADHGLEGPQDRVKAGKPESGTITLNAFHEGGHIIIQISDDGKGLPIDKIKAKAVANGLVTQSEIDAMSDQQIAQFIFKAGLSTAAKVTSVSGRGVGMDVVKSNIEKIGGTIEISSQPGKGSRFTIKIPLTLAIVSTLIVESCGDRFAIPQLSVVELVLVSPKSEHRIEEINTTPVLRLRNQLLPLLTLRKILELGEPETPPASCYIVVCQAGNTNFGIVVDKVHDMEEIVVKPVSPVLRHIDLYSGNTILGDGSVIMILDPNGMAARTGEARSAAHEDARHVKTAAKKEGESTVFMLFRAGEGAPKAVPLSLISRLEDVDMAKTEESAGQRMIQYRGRLMPLLPMNDNFEIPKEGSMPVLVFTDRERSMGLIVQEVLDIVEDKLEVDIHSAARTEGMLGSAIIAGKATDVIDAGYFLTQAFGDWFGAKDDVNIAVDATARRILLVDDSAFFRNLLTPLLSVAGYDVTAVETPSQAIELCESGTPFDAIVSDIEMPGMSGYEFASKMRGIERWSKLPIIALTSHAAPKDMERSHEAGFTDHVAKFDRDRLLVVLAQTLSQQSRLTA